MSAGVQRYNFREGQLSLAGTSYDLTQILTRVPHPVCIRSTQTQMDEQAQQSLDDDDESLTADDLLCKDSYFVQGLQNLNLDADFSKTILAVAEQRDDSALEQAAEVTVALAAASRERTQRQQLAAISYRDKVISRPKGTSSAYASGVRHFQVFVLHRTPAL